MKSIKTAAYMLALSSLVMPAAVFAGVREDAVDKVIENYMPGVTGFGRVVVKGVTINDAQKRITIKLNDNAAYIPFTAERFAQFKSDCKKSLGAKFANYSVTVLAKNKNLEKLVLFAQKRMSGLKKVYHLSYATTKNQPLQASTEQI